MHESEAYYEETLYPLQNGVLSTLAACKAPFYLTGGTALHRVRGKANGLRSRSSGCSRPCERRSKVLTGNWQGTMFDGFFR